MKLHRISIISGYHIKSRKSNGLELSIGSIYTPDGDFPHNFIIITHWMSQNLMSERKNELCFPELDDWIIKMIRW